MSEFDTFSDDARAIFRRAEDEARSRGQTYLGTEHVLLGLLTDPESAARDILTSLDADPDRIRTAVEIAVASDSSPTTGQIKFTPRTLTVIDLTIEEATRFRHNPIGPEHVLLGLIAEREGIAAGILENAGVSLDLVRVEILLHSQASGTEPLNPDIAELADVEQRRQALIDLIEQINWTPERVQAMTHLLARLQDI